MNEIRITYEPQNITDEEKREFIDKLQKEIVRTEGILRTNEKSEHVRFIPPLEGDTEGKKPERPKTTKEDVIIFFYQQATLLFMVLSILLVVWLMHEMAVFW